MKKIFIVLALATVISCNNKKSTTVSDTHGADTAVAVKPTTETKQDGILGKWKVIAVESTQMPESLQKDAIASATMEFTKEGTYKSVDSKETSEGKYSFDETTGDLSIYSTNATGADTTHMGIEWDTDKNMVMIFPAARATKVTLRKME